MYKYKPKDYQPQVGDICEHESEGLFIVSHRFDGWIGYKEDYGYFPSRCRTLETKPGSEAKVGDTCIVIEDHGNEYGPKRGVVFEVTELVDYVIRTDIPSEEYGTFGFSNSEKIKVLIKEQTMNIQNEVINIKDSSLADRLRLRQVLLDNGEDTETFSAGLWSRDKIGQYALLYCDSWQSNCSESTISLEDFITKYKKQDQVRNLAFYKKSGEDWTNVEEVNVLTFVGEEGSRNTIEKSNKRSEKYYFDDGDPSNFMHPWTYDRDNFNNCLQVAYEDVFPEGNSSETTINKCANIMSDESVPPRDRLRAAEYILDNVKAPNAFVRTEIPTELERLYKAGQGTTKIGQMIKDGFKEEFYNPIKTKYYNIPKETTMSETINISIPKSAITNCGAKAKKVKSDFKQRKPISASFYESEKRGGHYLETLNFKSIKHAEQHLQGLDNPQQVVMVLSEEIEVVKPSLPLSRVKSK